MDTHTHTHSRKCARMYTNAHIHIQTSRLHTNSQEHANIISHFTVCECTWLTYKGRQLGMAIAVAHHTYPLFSCCVAPSQSEVREQRVVLCAALERCLLPGNGELCVCTDGTRGQGQ